MLSRVGSSLVLEDRIAELEEEVLQLREQLVPTRAFPPWLRLTKKEGALLSFVLARSPGVAMKERVHFAVYPDPDEAPDLKIIDVLMFKIRAKLRPYGLCADTVWGDGYLIDRTNASRLTALLDGAPPEPVEPAPAPALPPPPPSEAVENIDKAAITPAPKPVLAPAPPADPPRAGYGLSALQIRTIKGFESAGLEARFIARQVDVPLAIVKKVLKGVRT